MISFRIKKNQTNFKNNFGTELLAHSIYKINIVAITRFTNRHTFNGKLVPVARYGELNSAAPLGVVAAAEVRNGFLASLVHVHVACYDI